ncbi:LacI family transcriptional regulator [Motilibacter rhizosphaerae]|uniref:LacI family transcriptional regulator n=1 Tax=Motilibacter rhizosphaerae TaxID=598652 RepID=A0A4Q7NP44_9ACTN|nr:LacI family DNA-binding transcriptional regulator [Motilibacter rhizosphaerae]RZS87029.1 LacI family transcriptional regulator [Motilibacter rhizosphaerae]
MARITLDDVAREAGVSRMTVSNTYGYPERVAPATRERVLHAASTLGYGGPSAVGRTLRRGSTGVLGLLLNEALPYAFTDPGTSSFMRGLAEEAAAQELSLQIVQAVGDRARTRVMDSAVDAFVALALEEDDPGLAAVLDRRIPLVTLGSPALPGVPHLGVDNLAGARAAAEHAVGLGYERFVVLVWELGAGVARERLQGYRAALPVEPEVLRCRGNTRAEGRATAARLLDTMGDRRTAVLAATDVLALGVLAAARDRGVSVPDRLGVVGFDDVEEAATSGPSLTTVHQDLAEQGRECVLRLAGLLATPTAPAPHHLVARESTS